MLLLLIAPQSAPAQPGFVNLAVALGDVWSSLNATGAADAIYWDTPELVGYMNEAIERLARKTGAFVERNQTLASVSGQASYDLPARNISVVQVDLAGVTLRPRTVQQLEALDADWPATVGDVANPPRSFVLDTQGFTKLLLYPIPFIDADVIGMVRATFPDAVAIDTSMIVNMPPIMADYFTLYAITEARAKESHASMDEIVPWLKGVLDTYEQLTAALWGIN